MIFIPFFIISMWIATQNVAGDCGYDPILGSGIEASDIKIYAPWMFFIWKFKYGFVMPVIITSAQKYLIVGTAVGFILGIFTAKSTQNLSSYGSAKWASSKEIRKSGINQPDGVTIGINPYKFKSYTDGNLYKKLLHDNGPAHIGVFAPTRSGKGAAIIIPTCLEWNHSLVVLDLKGENFNFTASYRKKALKNKIIKFEPFCEDDTTAKWNPISEVRMGTKKEISDVMSLAHMIADPTGKGGEKGDSHWIDTSTALIQTVILHLLYAHKRQDLPIPTLSDVSDFLSSKSMPFDEAIDLMLNYPHISTEDFFKNNILEKIYGNYIAGSFKAFNENLKENGVVIDVNRLKEIKMKLREEVPELIEKYGSQFRSIREIQEYYKDEFEREKFSWEGEENPFHTLLTHPKVADGAAECKNRDSREQGSVTSSANAKFNLYRDPVIAKNTSMSEFVSTDLMNPMQPVTVYLVIPPNKVQDAIPLIRIFINYVLDRNMESMEFSNSKNKQRCLFLLDEFPQLGRIEKMETGMAIMAGYGLKVLLIAQDINQVNKNYSKDNSIISNCHIRIFYTPNDTETAKNICDFLGKETIKVTNVSQAGSFKTNKSWNQTGRELLTLSEITQLPKDDEIILMAGLPPIKAKKAWYFRIKYFMDRCKNDTYPEAIAYGLKSDTVTVIDSYKKFDILNKVIKNKKKDIQPEEDIISKTYIDKAECDEDINETVKDPQIEGALKEAEKQIQIEDEESFDENKANDKGKTEKDDLNYLSGNKEESSEENKKSDKSNEEKTNQNEPADSDGSLADYDLDDETASVLVAKQENIDDRSKAINENSQKDIKEDAVKTKEEPETEIKTKEPDENKALDEKETLGDNETNEEINELTPDEVAAEDEIYEEIGEFSPDKTESEEEIMIKMIQKRYDIGYSEAQEVLLQIDDLVKQKKEKQQKLAEITELTEHLKRIRALNDKMDIAS